MIAKCFSFVAINPIQRIIYFENKDFVANSIDFNIARDEYFNLIQIARYLNFKIVDISTLSFDQALCYFSAWEREVEKTRIWQSTFQDIDDFVSFKHIIFARMLNEYPYDQAMYKILIFNEVFRKKNEKQINDVRKLLNVKFMRVLK